MRTPDGVVAQLVEHHNGIVGVRGSNPLGSTISNIVPKRLLFLPCFPRLHSRSVSLVKVVREDGLKFQPYVKLMASVVPKKAVNIRRIKKSNFCLNQGL